MMYGKVVDNQFVYVKKERKSGWRNKKENLFILPFLSFFLYKYEYYHIPLFSFSLFSFIFFFFFFY